MGIKAVKRKSGIVSRLKENGEVSVSELVDAFNVSEVTIRRDLEELESKGLLLRTYGGAVNKEESEISSEFVYGAKKEKNVSEKKAIAEAAFKKTSSGETVYLDSGTTIVEIARLIKKSEMDLTVVTNSFPVVLELLQSERVNLFLLGGFLRKKLYDFYGPFIKDEIANLSINRAFLGVDAISGKFGLTTTDASTAQVEEAVMENSCEIIVVADSSKIGRVSLISYGKTLISKIPCTLITDAGAGKDEIAALKKMGFSVQTVEPCRETEGGNAE